MRYNLTSMEIVNPWEDKSGKKHKNKKAAKPVKKVKLETPENKMTEYEEKRWKFVNELVEISLREFSPKSQRFGNEIFGEEWMDEFKIQIKNVKEDILESLFLPDEKTMVLLKCLFILQESQ